MSQQDSRELTIIYFIFYKKTMKKLVLAAMSFSWGDVIEGGSPKCKTTQITVREQKTALNHMYYLCINIPSRINLRLLKILSNFIFIVT